MRHPAPDIAPGICYGRLDIGLSAAGEASIGPMRESLRASGIGRLVTSPARRCFRLAHALAPTPIVDARLQELDFGAWEGLAWSTIPRALLDAWAADPSGFTPPGGESAAALTRRVRQACMALLEAGEDCIVVTHGGPLRLMPALLRADAPGLLAPAPPLGSILPVHVTQTIAVSPAHSAATAHPPSTSPVKPPI